jgi:hypothetical protein
MKTIIFALLIIAVSNQAETLFEIKDSANNPVLNISTDGLRVMNLGDTLMVISATDIRANISSSKGLSRAFSVTTASSKGKGLVRVLDVDTKSSRMKEGEFGLRYMDFSPENIFLGLNSGISTVPVNETSGKNNVFVGNESGRTNTSGASNVFMGYKSGYSNLTGYSNCFIGQESGYTNYSGRNNVFLGYKSGRLNYDGDFNVFIGNNAGSQNVSGDRNVFIGYEAGTVNSTGWGNTFVGEASGTANGDGYGNSFFGRNSGFSTTNGDYNTASGSDAGSSNTTGNYNSSFGAESAMLNYAGSSNSVFGYQAGRGSSAFSYNNNSFFGYQSGYSTRTGSNNTYFGYGTGYTNIAGSRNVFLGYLAGYNETGSDKLYIDNSSTSNPLIYGDFDADWIKINGDFDVLNLATVGGLDVNNNAIVNGTFKVGTGATISRFSIDGTMATNSDSYVPTEKAVRTYVTASRDNLGNHIATQNIRLSGYYLSNDGGNEGVSVDNEGDVGIGTNSPGSNRLKVINNASGIAGATGYFENSNSTGIGLAAFATSTDAAFYAEQKNSTSTTANIAKFASQYGGWSEKVIFRSTGSVLMPYLGSSSGTSLQVTSGGEIVKLSSSRRYKKDIAPLSVDMKKFLSLQPVSFKWNEKSASENKADNGLIAEEVEKIDPALAVYNDKGEIEGVDYQKINIMLLKVVQQQQADIETMKKEINELKDRVKK